MLIMNTINCSHITLSVNLVRRIIFEEPFILFNYTFHISIPLITLIYQYFFKKMWHTILLMVFSNILIHN